KGRRTRRRTAKRRRARAPRPSPPGSRSRPRRRSSVVTAGDVREAAAALQGVVVRTPLRYVAALDAYLKLENLQAIGAFKLRGAYNAIRKLPEAARRRGVITYSSGNHGQAVAYAAQRVGVRAVIVMPETAPAIKVAGVRKWGGEVVLAGRTSEDRHRAAEAIAAREPLAAGRPTRLERTESIADGLITLTVGDVPFAHLVEHRARVAGVALVDDASLREAVHFLWRECHLAVEPSGAATTAALRSRALQPRAPTVLVVSGGNVDPSLLEA